jgi:hypothetical protein
MSSPAATLLHLQSSSTTALTSQYEKDEGGKPESGSLVVGVRSGYIPHLDASSFHWESHNWNPKASL